MMNAKHQIAIPLPPIFSFEECLWFLNRNYDDCLHSIKKNEVIKAIEVDGQPVLFSVKQSRQKLAVDVLQGDLDKITELALSKYVSDWFDVGKDIAPFYVLLEKEKRLAYMSTAFHGLRLVGINDLFEALCWSIIGQQINLSFAYSLKRRLVEAYGTKLIHNKEAHYIFPSIEKVAAIKVEDLRPMQFSRMKAEYVIGVAQAFAEGKISRAMIEALPDLESKQKALTALRGVGIWTANYSLMKSLRMPGCIPHGDIGLLMALVNHKIIKERSETSKIEAFFKKHKGWESYLVFYLWRSLSHQQ
jgi:DNA-3-methyladenine glycosylase II